jgi:hypothetical protein
LPAGASYGGSDGVDDGHAGHVALERELQRAHHVLGLARLTDDKQTTLANRSNKPHVHRVPRVYLCRLGHVHGLHLGRVHHADGLEGAQQPHETCPEHPGMKRSAASSNHQMIDSKQRLQNETT